MELKEYQQKALKITRTYLELLSKCRQETEAQPAYRKYFPAKAWEEAKIPPPYRSRENGLGAPLPNFCMKIPTGGGKTLLAVKTIDLVNTIYRRKNTGLILWIVPTTQIYRQTIRRLRDRDHPYRQHLDIASGGKTRILEKTDRFSLIDVENNLVVLMLMLPSANRQTKETLKVFKDSGGFTDFFPREDDINGQQKLLNKVPNLDTFEKESGFWGKQIKTSLGNVLRILSPLIILDEGHKAYSEGAQSTLRGFNPCMIVELSATPTEQSNILVDIPGRELHHEEMIKLDLHVTNKLSPDWKDAFLAAYEKRESLEKKARDYEANTGIQIRPICLIQVERTGADQRSAGKIHSEDVREHLVKTMGIAAEQVAVKTSEKDELKEVDDVGGLLSKNCPIRFIITKQALQEGWDCSFAYVLAILSNPSSKNALTQLVGRILRQPFAKKTGVKELDESYVFCYQQRAKSLLESVKKGFEREGLGDLKGQIRDDTEEGGAAGDGEEEIYEIRERFQRAASQTFLPVFVTRDENGWRPVNYEMDISSRIRWDETELSPIVSVTLSMTDEKDIEHVATLSEDSAEVIKAKKTIELKEGTIRLDPVFMARQICDIVPNPWMAHEFGNRVLSKLLEKHDEKLVVNNFVFIIEELRKHLDGEKDRLSEKIFKELLENDSFRFLLIGKSFDFTFPQKIAVAKDVKTLTRKDGRPLQGSLFEFEPEDQFNGLE